MCKHKNLQKLFRRTINICFWLCMAVVLWFVLQIFVFATFRIPSRSMYPTLDIGDYVLVLKPIVGPRLFNLYASLQNEQTEIYRFPGLRKVKRGDVLVFNYPYPNGQNEISMHILKYHIKRCVGLPGDTLSIEDGFFHIAGTDGPIGNMDTQIQINKTDTFEDKVFITFPYDSLLNWNVRDFGPFFIPRKGDSILLNRTNALLYGKIIEWEQQEKLLCRDSLFILGREKVEGYRFKKNYYFMVGDNGMDSSDSRYWGVVPEEYIVGKAWLIWKSYNPFTGKFQWERFMKRID